MIDTLHLALSPLYIPRSSKSLPLPWSSIKRLQTPRFSFTKAKAAVINDTTTVDYSSTISVFPAEACKTIGGEACDVEMYPEVKLKPEAKTTTANTATEQIDIEYLEYSSPKTVFLEEACDDLGGEFCKPEYLQS